MNYAENRIYTGQPEYDKQFWDSMKGVPFAEDRLEVGRSSATGTFALPVSADNKYEAEINKVSVFRKLASVFVRYNGAVNIITANSDDIAEFVPESESIDIRDVVDDFDTVRVTATKLATLLRLPSEFVADAAFNLEGYLIKRLARNFARAEDKGFITGTGTDEPVGILDDTAGAETAATVETITYDDIIALYRKIKGGCTSHQIRNEVIEQILLDHLQALTAYARDHEADFVELITKKSQAELDRSLRDGKRELEQAQARIHKLDEIIQRLYEDSVEGKISDERFVKMSASYEEEQKGLESRVSELKKLIAAEKENSVNVDRFLALVRKYTDVKELTAEIIREFVQKIYVHQSERIDGQKVQRIRIVWNCIGEFTLPTITDIEKSA